MLGIMHLELPISKKMARTQFVACRLHFRR